MPVREHDFNREIVNMFNQIRYEWRTNPVILGGSSGSEGGSSGAPGGTIGQISQRSVAGDTTEANTFISSGSINSILDNMKRIRYWELPSRQLGLEEHVPATATWAVSSGSWYYADATYPMSYAGGNTPPITLPSSGSRIDLLMISTAGILQWAQGTEGVYPTPPAIPSSTGSIPLWLCLIRSSGSACRNVDNGVNSHYIYQDMRPFIGSTGGGGSSGSFNEVGAIPYVSGSGPLTTDGTGLLHWDTVYKRLMRGSGTFGAYEATFGFPGIYNINLANDGSGFVPIAYGAGAPGITGIKINGTIAAPTAVLAGDILVRMSGRGWSTSSLGNASRAKIEAVAEANWSDGDQGARWDFYSTGSGGTTPVKAVTITNSQHLQVHNLATGNRLIKTDNTGRLVESLVSNSSVGTTFPLSIGNFGLFVTHGSLGVEGSTIIVGNSSQVTHTVLNLGNNSVTAPAAGNMAIGAGTLSVSSANNDTTSTHTHAITSSSNPGAAASILATDSSGSVAIGGSFGAGAAPLSNVRVNLGGTVSGAGTFGIYSGGLTLSPNTGTSAFFLYGGGGTVATGASNTITQAIGVHVANMTKSGTGSITTAYGLFVENITTGTANVSLHVAGGISNLGGGVRLGGDPGGAASTTAFTNATDTTLTNTYAVKGGQAASTANTGWIKIYIGTSVSWIPYWTNATP